MNREQMIAWLTLEGWEPARERTFFGVTKWLGVARGDWLVVPECYDMPPGSIADADPAVRWRAFILAHWRAFSLEELSAIYKKASTL